MQPATAAVSCLLLVFRPDISARLSTWLCMAYWIHGRFHQQGKPYSAALQNPRYLVTCVQEEAVAAPGPSSNGAQASGGNAGDDDRLPHQRWQGKSTRFMRSNDHSQERAGAWDTQGLEGSALALVQGDEKSGRCGGSWQHASRKHWVGMQSRQQQQVPG